MPNTPPESTPPAPQGLEAIIAVMQDRLANLDVEASRIRRAIAELRGEDLPAILRPQPPVHPLHASTGKAKAPAKKRPRKRLAIVAGSRLDRILNDVRSHPDTITPDIAKRTGIDDTSITKLLKQLREAELISSTVGAGRHAHSRHSPVGEYAVPMTAAVTAPQAKPKPATRNRGINQHTHSGPSRAEQVLADLQAHPGTTGRDASERTGLPDTTIYNVARKLIDSGIVRRDSKPGNQASTYTVIAPPPVAEVVNDQTPPAPDTTEVSSSTPVTTP